MLHAVVDYARSRGMTAEAGFKPKTVRWLLVFTPEGDFQGVMDYEDKANKVRGRTFEKSPDLPRRVLNAGKGVRYFLADNLDAVLPPSAEEWSESDLAKQQVKHEFFLELLQEAKTVDAVFGIFAMALANPDVIRQIREELNTRKAKSTESVTLAVQVDGVPWIPLAEDVWHDWWRTKFRRIAGQTSEEDVVEDPGETVKASKRKAPKKAADVPSRMRCLLSGSLTDPEPTHQKIDGLAGVGGFGMGDAVSSFDKDAFCSFGLTQGANAAMSEEMATTYVAALNRLIKEKSVQLAGTKVLYWYSRELPAEKEFDLFSDVFGFGGAAVTEDDGDSAEKTSATSTLQAENRAKTLLESIRTGGDPNDLGTVRYCALTLSGNSGRVMIRDWMEGQFEDLAQAVSEWWEDLTIVSRTGDAVIPRQQFAEVLAATVRNSKHEPGRDLKDVPASLVTSLWRCVVQGRDCSIPTTAAAQTLRRVTLDILTDQPARHARLALLKAFLIRSERKIPMTADLNLLETDPAYLSGRVMALLGRIQYEALGDVGAGVVQRYYAAASATPALILGRLVRLAQTAHLPKISNVGLRIWFEKQLGEVWSRMASPPPTVLSLEQQTMFAMGYYHQLAQRGGGKLETENQPPVSA